MPVEKSATSGEKQQIHHRSVGEFFFQAVQALSKPLRHGVLVSFRLLYRPCGVWPPESSHAFFFIRRRRPQRSPPISPRFESGA